MCIVFSHSLLSLHKFQKIKHVESNNTKAGTEPMETADGEILIEHEKLEEFNVYFADIFSIKEDYL